MLGNVDETQRLLYSVPSDDRIAISVRSRARNIPPRCEYEDTSNLGGSLYGSPGSFAIDYRARACDAIVITLPRDS